MLHQVSATLTDAQIRALPSTPVTLAPAISGTAFYVPLYGIFRAHLVQPYIVPNNCWVVAGGNHGLWLDSIINEPVEGWVQITNLLGTLWGYGDQIQPVSSGQAYSTQEFATIGGELVWGGGPNPAANQPLIVDGWTASHTPFTGGDPGNTLIISVLYTTFDLATNAFS